MRFKDIGDVAIALQFAIFEVKPRQLELDSPTQRGQENADGD